MTNDIIVFLPGIGGSRLERNRKAIYDLSLSALPKLIWNWVGGDLAYNGGSGKPDDGVVATDLFNNQLIPGFFGIDDYDGLCRTLKGAVHNPVQQFFKFPYDWRASNRWAAEALDAFVRPKLHDWRKDVGGSDAKLCLVCHSMGGLVARYFLEHLGGADITRHLITIGTPHRGAPKALNALVNGIGLGPLDFSHVIRSFASTYELLPHYPVVRIGEGVNGPLARVSDFFGLSSTLPVANMPGTKKLAPTDLRPLPHIDPVRLQDALAFHAAIQRPVIQRMENGLSSPYDISCVFNRRQPTPQSARWSAEILVMSDDSPTLASTDDEAFSRGDGTVPGPSAIPIEWEDATGAIAIDEKHVAMPSAKAVMDIVRNNVRPLSAKNYMSDPQSDGSIGLAVPPIVFVGQAFEIVVDVIKQASLSVTITPVKSEIIARSEYIDVADRSSARIEFTLHEEGTYLIIAKSVADFTRPVISDWLTVITLS